MPLFSVIIPAYNSAAFLPQALDSLLRQTMPGFEVVIVNDGSVDNTQDIIDAYCEKDARFRCIAQENAGVSAARNNGLAAAAGDYVTFLDADDYYDKDTLAAFQKRINETNADLLLGRLCMTSGERSLGFHAMADVLAKEPGAIDRFDKRLLWNFLVSNKCYRRAFLLENGVRFPATGFSEEGAFFMDAVYAGATIASAWDSVVWYRRHTDAEGLSVSQTANVKNLESLFGSMTHILEAAKKAKGTDDLTDDYLQEVLYKHAHILVSQFYRALWQMDDAAQALCVSQLQSLFDRLTDERLAAIRTANRDLRLCRLCRTKADAANNPQLCVRVSARCSEESAKALFAQSCPFFVLSLSPEAATSLPGTVLGQANVRVEETGEPAGVPVLRFAALPVFDPSLLQTLLRLPVPKTATAAKLLQILLKRRHGG